MKDRKNTEGQPLSCPECLDGLQEYLDGTLEKQRSLLLFLHLRDCPACDREHEQLKHLYEVLQTLPDHPVPEGFDDPILASVPYEAYRAMEPIRRERVPVYLEEDFLPAWIRSGVTRWGGTAIAAGAAAATWAMDLPLTVAATGAIGLVPAVLVALQGAGRRVALTLQRTES